MKIAVIGTHGVGKSTLVSEFTKIRPDFVVIPEFAREMIEERHGRIDSWFDFQLELMKLKIEAEAKNRDCENLISDRTIVDNWAYCWFYKCFPESLIYSLRELAIGYCNWYYDLFVYLPASDFVITKSIHAERCAKIDEAIGKLTKRLKEVAVLKGSVEERVDRLLRIVEERERKGS